MPCTALQDRVSWGRDVRWGEISFLVAGERISKYQGRRNRIYNLWFDHEILRILWTNTFEIAPGVFRSNQPTKKRFALLRDQGIHTILNLRGANPNGHYLAEQQFCGELELNLHSIRLNARSLVPRDTFIELISLFRTLDRPLLMHCKSGADRAGLASAIYMMVIEHQPVEQAQRMLSWRYMHVRNRYTGILDYCLEIYAARTAREPIGFEDWVAQEYDPVTITDRFRKRLSPV
ncbi:MAG: tyrosine-protein phosphatase [Rhodobacteraceae bacterium]|nr:tyrosine-protein phosphatase [Paracoccaceae bacterium]